LLLSQPLLGAFAQSRNAPVALVMSIRPSTCPHVSLWLPLDEFMLNLILGTFMKIYQEIPDLVKTGKNIGDFT
jgi:hypothetical protein